jgi:hypothetical protein
MTDLQKAYEGWPQEAKDEFWALLAEILHWRAWDTGTGGHDKNPRALEVERIAGLFEENGLEIMEYT